MQEGICGCAQGVELAAGPGFDYIAKIRLFVKIPHISPTISMNVLGNHVGAIYPLRLYT